MHRSLFLYILRIMSSSSNNRWSGERARDRRASMATAPLERSARGRPNHTEQ